MSKTFLCFLLLLSSLSWGQNKGHFRLQPDIPNISIVYKPVNYTNAPVTITASVAGGVTVALWKWEVTNSSTGSLADLSFDQSPIFTNLTTSAYYDIKLTASNGGDSWVQTLRHILRVLQPRYTEGECDEVIDVANGSYFKDFTATATPDYKIGLKGTGTAFIQPYGLHGTAGHPARIQVLGNSDVNLTGPSAAPHVLRMDGNVQYVIVDGSKDDGTIGLKITFTGASNTQAVMLRDGLFTDVEFLRISVTQSLSVHAAAFSFVPTVSSGSNATNWTINNLCVMYCSTTSSGDEGVYMNFNNDTPQGGFQPPKCINPIIAWNTFTNCGRDGIQPASSINIEVHDNVINGWGKHDDVGGQQNAISWNAGNVGYCYNNFAVNGNLFLNIQSGQSPWNIYTGETTPKDSYFWGNVFINGTYSNPNDVEPFSNYIQITNGTGAGAGHLNYHIFDNTFICDKKFGEMYWGTSSFTSDKISCVDNIIVKVGNAGTTPELNFNGPGTHPSGGQYLINNLVRNSGSESDLLFNNQASNDLTIPNLASPAYGGGTTNIASRFPELSNYYRDAIGFPLITSPYTFGAYTGYPYRTIPPPAGDPDPGSFSTPVTMTSLTQSGGTLGYEADKNGLLYYIFSLVDVSPTVIQVRQGKLASGSAAPVAGTLLDAGSVIPKVVTGGTENTAYYLFCVFVTANNVPQVSTTRVAFSTAPDTTPPTLSNWKIFDANKDRIYFDSSEPITGSTFANFTIATPSKTLGSVTIVGGQTTGHYFTVTVAFQVDDVPTIAYAGGDNFKDTAGTPNNLASFGATPIINQIPPAPEETWTVGQSQAGSLTTDDWTSTGAGGLRSGQKIPSNSTGYVKFGFNASSTCASPFTDLRIGIILDATTFTYSVSQLLGSMVFLTNTNTDVYEGSTFRASHGGIQVTSYQFRFKVSRPDGSTNNLTADWSQDGGVTWSNEYSFGNIAAGALRGALVTGVTGKVAVDLKIQANKGLQ